MSRWLFPILILFILTPPLVAFADCSPEGATVVYVNGIFTNKEQADGDTFALGKTFERLTGREDVTFTSGYNPSHLGGGGDLIESITQAFGKPVSDYDLDTILMQIHPEVTTRKILLLGHSQGSFYTDEMYEYLTTHGVPKESIAVYNIATPESYVGGGGGYLTSTNDKVINAVRDAEVNGNLQVYLNSYYVHTSNVVNSALRANITIPKEAGWDTDPHGGHLPSVYLDNAAPRIVADIQRELSALKSVRGDNSADGCFVPPTQTLAYKAQKALLAASDTLVGRTSSVGTVVENGALALAQGTFGAFAAGVQNTFTSADSQGQTTAAALPFDNQLQTQSSRSSPPPAVSTDVSAESLQRAPAQTAAPMPAHAPTGVTPPTTPPAAGIPSTPLVPVTPGFGGGGGGTDVAQTQNQSSPSQQSQGVTIPLVITSPSDGEFAATTSVVFSGTTDADAHVVATFGSSSASTSADGSGGWSLPLTLQEGDIRVDITAADGAGHSSATASRTVTVDITPPATTTPSVAACAASLLSDACLLPITDTDVTWGAATGASYYAVAKNGVVDATTTTLSSRVTLVPGVTTTLAVVAYDTTGNAATSTVVDVAAITQPLVINEIGWAGTDTDPTNQWIEIKNMSSYTLDLAHVALARSGGTPIQLSGSLPSATNQNLLVVAPGDIRFFGAHVLTASFPALSTTTAEQLSLVWDASTTLDVTPAVSSCSGWCAGSYRATLGSNVSGLPGLTSPLSMERKTNADGTLASNWQSTDSYGPWLPATSVNSDLWGTPGVDNSPGFPDAGVYCGSKTNILVPGAPPGPAFSPGNDCVFLSRFVTGNTFGAARFGGVFRGDVASSTGAGLPLFKGLAYDVAVNIQSQSPTPGEHFFFAIWENRSFGNDASIFNFYLTQGASSTQGISGPPHGNYVTLPFTYSP